MNCIFNEQIKSHCKSDPCKPSCRFVKNYARECREAKSFGEFASNADHVIREEGFYALSCESCRAINICKKFFDVNASSSLLAED